MTIAELKEQIERQTKKVEISKKNNAPAFLIKVAEDKLADFQKQLKEMESAPEPEKKEAKPKKEKAEPKPKPKKEAAPKVVVKDADDEKCKELIKKEREAIKARKERAAKREEQGKPPVVTPAEKMAKVGTQVVKKIEKKVEKGESVTRDLAAIFNNFKNTVKEMKDLKEELGEAAKKKVRELIDELKKLLGNSKYADGGGLSDINFDYKDDYCIISSNTEQGEEWMALERYKEGEKIHANNIPIVRRQIEESGLSVNKKHPKN